jgi:hypothetical protein
MEGIENGRNIVNQEYGEYRVCIMVTEECYYSFEAVLNDSMAAIFCPFAFSQRIARLSLWHGINIWFLVERISFSRHGIPHPTNIYP